MNGGDLTTLLEILAVAALVAGVAFIYWPAGLIVLGCLLGAAAYRLEQGQAKEADTV